MVFAIIAGFILLMASINYINLATARSLKRAKEIGVLKVLGAVRRQLAWQYISESLILTGFAFVIALSLVEILMPQFNRLVDKDLTLIGSLFSQGGILFGSLLVVLIFVLSILSGIFPATVLSYLQPVNALKGNKILVKRDGRQQYSTGRLRKFLVTVQYIVTIGMIISTIIIFQQMSFLKRHELGFNDKNILVINLPQDTSFRQRTVDFIEEFSNKEGISEAALTGNVPGYTAGKRMFYTADSTDLMTFNFFIVGQNYLKLLDQMGILDIINQNINSLSGGQLQRVFIIRAMLNNPEVLILDEPTASIDKQNTEFFYQTINELNKQGITVILITHTEFISHINYTHLLTMSLDLTFNIVTNDKEDN